ncbi:MAG: macromolecule metabolism; macromolecule degradation; degradation of polysaccharides, partial [uncultured Acetobacteraceae bacterium]
CRATGPAAGTPPPSISSTTPGAAPRAPTATSTWTAPPTTTPPCPARRPASCPTYRTKT